MRKYLNGIGKKLLKKVESHPGLTFITKENSIFYGSINPLQKDEAEYLKSKYKIDNFKFNNGHVYFYQQYYIAFVQNVFVEPDHCIAIKGFSSIIKESIFYDWYQVSKLKYVKERIFFWQIKNFKSAILFDGTVGLNYFHFHNDILTKLSAVRKHLENATIPLIIGNKLFHSTLFQFYFQFDFVRNNNWYILKENEYLKVHQLYIIKAKQFDAEPLLEIAGTALQCLKTTPNSLLFSTRIFINRRECSGRYISNFSQLQTILTKYSFKTVYLEDVDIPGQIGMMSSAELIVGIHGAGLTNLIFADKEKAQVIEILPKNFQPTHYYWLCDILSIKYKAFFGADLIADKGFEIDVERFEEIIVRCIKSL